MPKPFFSCFSQATAGLGYRFFSQKSFHNMSTFYSGSLMQVAASLPVYRDMLDLLQAKGYFQNKNAVDLNSQDALKRIFPGAKDKLHFSPVELLADSSPVIPLQRSSALNIQDVPRVCASLVPDMNAYIDKLCQVQAGKLAMMDYEAGLPTAENVSERTHGLQAGLMAYRLGMSFADITALQFHDIARCTRPNVRQGHVHHHKEGSVILAPLGGVKDFTLHHPFGKYLLHETSSYYRSSMISPLSTHSLTLQLNAVPVSVKLLSQLDNMELALAIYKILYMRAIEDLSKVPEKMLQGFTVPYFDAMTSKKILVGNFIDYLNEVIAEPAFVRLLARQINTAMTKLSRADHINELPKSAEPLSSLPSLR